VKFLNLTNVHVGVVCIKKNFNFAASIMVDVAQQVRASDCGSEGRGFEPHLPPGVLLKT
jgi:hypothetical protein